MKKLKFIISAALLGGLAWRTDWEHVGEAFARLRPELWLAAVGLYALTQVVSGWRWRLLARPLGFDRPWRQFVGIYYVGMFFNLVLPTSVGGDLVRAWYLDHRGNRKLRAFYSVLADRGSGLVILLTLACLAALACPVVLPAWIPWSVWGTAGVAAIVGAVVFWRVTRPSAANGTLTAVIVTYLNRPRMLLATTGLSVLVQAANVVLVWLIGVALAADVPASFYWIMVPMVTLLTLVPVSLNGMGIREGGTVLFLSQVGVPEGTALTIAVLWFAVMAVNSLAGGLVYLLGTFPRPQMRDDHGSVGDRSDQGREGQPAAAARQAA